ncbi:MAG: plasmid pRiA4b ORF-3 family protein [Bacteroidales bacterium]|nr:plasmid pRiA4b ORF-3 family protein [Bacteroidales bacterium]
MLHQLTISLDGFEPEIWRSSKINSNSTFEDLHVVIQIVMGWENYHLYEFRNKNFVIGIEPDEDSFADLDLIPADTIKIADVLPRKRSNIMYTYDFGDSWDHKIVVEEIFRDEIILNPVCIAGAMNCPPEDCGGIWGYSELLEIIRNKKHPEHKGVMEWLGGYFDPQYFNLKDINNILSKLKRRRQKK